MRQDQQSTDHTVCWAAEQGQEQGQGHQSACSKATHYPLQRQTGHQHGSSVQKAGDALRASEGGVLMRDCRCV